MSSCTSFERAVAASKFIIDHLDLSLRLNPSLLSAVEHTLSVFNEEHVHIEVAPKLKGKLLHINSNDLIALLGYIEVDDFSEIELKALETEIIFQLDQQLLRSTGMDARAHYRWCIAAVKNFRVGRFVAEPERPDPEE